MNEVIQCLTGRQSVKQYRPEQIRPEELDAIVTAGTYAPSGMGRQPCRIVVLQKKEDIAELEKLNAAILGNPDAHPFYGAPTVCVVLADAGVNTAVEDGSLVLGNMLNAARNLSTMQNNPILWLAPGIVLSLFVLAVNFFGDGLRDVFDVTQE